MALPFRDGAFDLVLSHAVIEHVADAPLYLRECARVLAPGGHVYLSTAPYLSFAGAHLPRLKIPVPLHLLVGRRVAFATFRLLARHARVDAQGAGATRTRSSRRRGAARSSTTTCSRRSACARLRAQIAARRPAHRPRGAARHGDGPAAAGAASARWLRDSPLTQDVLISNMEYVLAGA